MVPLKYQKNENLEKKYYKLITQSRNERFIEEIDEKCQCYLKMPFKNLVCASPEEFSIDSVIHNITQDYPGVWI